MATQCPSPAVIASGHGAPPDLILKVGPKLKEFAVHSYMLKHHSGYFHVVLHNGNMVQQFADGMSPLQSVEPDVFQVFINWVYNERLPDRWPDIVDPTCHTESEGDEGNGGAGQENWIADLLMMKIYVFATDYEVPALKSAVAMDITGFGDVDFPPFLQIVKYAFNNLKREDPILDFLVDTNCLFWDPDEDQSEDEKKREEDMYELIPNSFLLRCRKRYAEWRKYGLSMNMKELEWNVCSYHQHTTEEEEEKCRTEQAKVWAQKSSQTSPATKRGAEVISQAVPATERSVEASSPADMHDFEVIDLTGE
ncbi:hypothetical protein BCR34DRAFT_589645 [Clohesyomyces aquaticus]|uniref:BTB domain-containing protein n=1 Tax=Clohesyomyces aquaticus TaxID=1231657 RepID=A0A1Y1ZF50_9PLEO|nr:hypothetical protein BCR34DRAFT_589645 [Clohesyomyces aquaticus]